MNLVIAEKNEAARDIAAAICDLGVKPSEIRLPAQGNGFSVCAASGHLLGLAEPADVDARYAKTEPEDLPIRIYPWPKTAQGKYQREKLEQIGKMLEMCDGDIYHAGDADDEGQLIVDEILEHFGIEPTSPRVKRVYVNDNIAKNICKAFENATPNAEHVKDGLAAQARQLGDFCFGINESRLASARLHSGVSVGRVQTPTLGLVIGRDMAREKHSKREYYELELSVKTPDGKQAMLSYKPGEELLEDGKRCYEKPALAEIGERLMGKTIPLTLEREVNSKDSPMPYNLTDLTADMSARYNMTANDVMEATQTLRDTYKAITYNRAESRNLPSAHLDDAPAVIECAKGNISWQGEADPGKRHAAFDDAKVGAHHGIIPQETSLELKKMPQREARVYEAIATRYLCLFASPLVYDVTSGETDLECGGKAAYKHVRIVERGWTEYAPSQWSKVTESEGDAIEPGKTQVEVIATAIRERETTPPPAFTDGTLMKAMSSIARYVKNPQTRALLKEKDAASPGEHGSIGTAATRKDIIETLVERKYIERAKGGRLVSTELGRKFFAVIPDEIKTADMTARWYLIQKDVSEGIAAPDAVMNDVCDQFLKHRDTAYENASLKVTAGPCPRCGVQVEKRGSVWSCASNKSKRNEDGTYEDIGGCGFKILPIGGKAVTLKQATALLSGKAVNLSGCKSKNGGKPYSCKLRIASGEVKVEFPKARSEKGWKAKH